MRIWGKGNRRSNPTMETSKTKGNPGESYYNTMKLNNNLSYCYSYRYYVNHSGWQCLTNNRKRTHIANVSREESHTIAGASMKAQHKTLTDGSGTGKGWILAQQLRKSNWVTDQQDNWKQKQQQK